MMKGLLALLSFWLSLLPLAISYEKGPVMVEGRSRGFDGLRFGMTISDDDYPPVDQASNKQQKNPI